MWASRSISFRGPTLIVKSTFVQSYVICFNVSSSQMSRFF